tara:strand:- start:93 stop:257 length:165 start_codon:yes stop_codon:yes gene_type:complete
MKGIDTTMKDYNKDSYIEYLERELFIFHLILREEGYSDKELLDILEKHTLKVLH